jgi:hypothetical protein
MSRALEKLGYDEIQWKRSKRAYDHYPRLG